MSTVPQVNSEPQVCTTAATTRVSPPTEVPSTAEVGVTAPQAASYGCNRAYQGQRIQAGGGAQVIDVDLRKLFVGGIPRQVDKTAFEEFFTPFGEIEKISLIKDHSQPTISHRGFGFITFKDQSSTDKVLSESGKLKMNGFKLEFRIAVPNQLKPPNGLEGTTKLFVGSLPKDNFNSDMLRTYFEKFGEITESWVSPKGFGFITMTDINGVNKALIHGVTNGHQINGENIEVKWPRVKPRNLRPSYYAPYGYQQQGYGRAPYGYAMQPQYYMAPQPIVSQYPQLQHVANGAAAQAYYAQQVQMMAKTDASQQQSSASAKRYNPF